MPRWAVFVVYFVRGKKCAEQKAVQCGSVISWCGWWPGKEWHLCDVQARARGWQQTSLQTGDTAVCLLVFYNFDINVKSCCTIFGEGPFYFEDCC